MVKGTSWKNLTQEQRLAIASRRYIDQVPTGTLAEELGMSPITLNRRLQEMRPAITGEDVEKRQDKLHKDYYKQYDPMQFNSAVFDIETTDFSAGGIDAHLVCCVILPLNSDEPEVLQIEYKDKRSDTRLLKEVSRALSKYQILIGHYITGFDLPWLNTRLAYHQAPQLSGKFFTYDTYFAAKRMGLRPHRKSLAFLADFFHLKQKKTSIYPVSWSHIDSPNESMFYKTRTEIVDHCISDVGMNREVFYAEWPIDRSLKSLPVWHR